MPDHNTDRTARNPLDVPLNELNSEIREAIQKMWDIGFHAGFDAHNAVLTSTRSARLFVLLGRQADEQTRRVISLTKWIVGLTIGLGILTVGLLVATLVLLHIANHTDEQIRHIYEIAETQRHQNEKANASAPQKDGISR